MDIGKLKHRITIQRVINNGPLEDVTYEDYKTLWASIKNLHGREFIEAQKVNPKIAKKVVIRYLRELDPSLDFDVSKKFRVKYKNNYYNILYSDNIKEENRFLELMLEVE